MGNILDLRDPEIEFLDDLVEDLLGIFHVIAHTDVGDEAYIRESQEYVRTKYEPYLDLCRTHESHYVILAYDTLQGLLERDLTPEQIREECETALYGYLKEDIELEDLGEDDLEKWGGAFVNYFKE